MHNWAQTDDVDNIYDIYVINFMQRFNGQLLGM